MRIIGTRQAHTRLGTLPMKRTVTPIIMASNGTPMIKATGIS
jgi:hypothetical protein